MNKIIRGFLFICCNVGGGLEGVGWQSDNMTMVIIGFLMTFVSITLIWDNDI